MLINYDKTINNIFRLDRLFLSHWVFLHKWLNLWIELGGWGGSVRGLQPDIPKENALPAITHCKAKPEKKTSQLCRLALSTSRHSQDRFWFRSDFLDVANEFHNTVPVCTKQADLSHSSLADPDLDGQPLVGNQTIPVHHIQHCTQIRNEQHGMREGHYMLFGDENHVLHFFRSFEKKHVPIFTEIANNPKVKKNTIVSPEDLRIQIKVRMRSEKAVLHDPRTGPFLRQTPSHPPPRVQRISLLQLRPPPIKCPKKISLFAHRGDKGKFEGQGKSREWI